MIENPLSINSNKYVEHKRIQMGHFQFRRSMPPQDVPRQISTVSMATGMWMGYPPQNDALLVSYSYHGSTHYIANNYLKSSASLTRHAR
ncbi:hypothetical protein CDAR_503161 [Caerostris darwini]|uniref:Uncharacterized protein n=1 Tax=Caerostris darwini TaxID=1538125 RepID=A0AAV4VMK8_9ARAC|nr:hypothetical protein CDAR_503161 [Caerostris darwini]